MAVSRMRARLASDRGPVRSPAWGAKGRTSAFFMTCGHPIKRGAEIQPRVIFQRFGPPLMTESHSAHPRSFDAVVVGGGHNGLTAAAYLARAGLSTLVLERRDIVGGCCVTEEIAPGCRVSTTSYIASMLRPEVISDLNLGQHGLRMVPCDPAIQVPFPDGHVVPWWVDRERAKAEFEKISAKDAETFIQGDDRLKKMPRYLQPFFLEPPPEVDISTLKGWADLFRVGKRLRRL